MEPAEGQKQPRRHDVHDDGSKHWNDSDSSFVVFVVSLWFNRAPRD
jgi:hypothetical protein